ncbi:unnamed protein product [Dicrocoelium dendriticum]|nr:unnamed protein product [Dicrocoelium dendriticum]
MVLASLELPMPYTRLPEPFYKYCKTDFNGLNRVASEVDWPLLQDSSVEACWSVIKEGVQSLCARFVPHKCRKAGPVKPHWFDKKFSHLARRRRVSWNTFLVSSSAEDYDAHK